MDDEKLLTGRLYDLYDRAEDHCMITYSEFLTLAEQETLRGLHLPGVTLEGGYENAERRIAVFRGSDCFYDEPLPLVCVRIAPRSEKYADQLTHRDILGSVLGLGIRREVTGDIILYENVAYLFCLESIADFLISELKKARHTDVDCSRTDAPPEASTALPDLSRIVVTSERLDSIVAAVWHISRSEAQTLFETERVSLGGRVVTGYTQAPAGHTIVSVRGYGRFIYEGIAGETKKGRLSADVRIYK